MISRKLALLCIITTTARVLGFALRPAGVASRVGVKPLNVQDTYHLVQLQRHQRVTTRLGVSDDFGEDSFGAKAIKERTNAELQDMVSSHNILAFIKVKHMHRLEASDFGVELTDKSPYRMLQVSADTPRHASFISYMGKIRWPYPSTSVDTMLPT